ncbi:hypothetical protein DUNSADRAFT_9318 [Dunaliella salina]|uniref:Uncharacterized protein n=1 Tax=Dunaliella salina TaxID=3046 RepID=A0ABQ7GHQ6_DUNSA|nr:hypothetical protein DUNSADRAFT_9318 [Dunaliella salina]|eukprot:KAF5834122.1 hypothetical protein DUNSADRAFT_9318 [Dunaliella salina]
MVTGVSPHNDVVQVGEVLECLMDLSEAVVASAFSVLSSTDVPLQRQRATVRQVFETGASILQDAPALMNTVVTLEHSRGGGAASSSLAPGKSASAPSTSSLSTILSRFKGILVSAAALASGPSSASTDTTTSAAANGHAGSNGGPATGAGAGAGARTSQGSVATTGAGARASQGSAATAGARASQGSAVTAANGGGVGAEGSPAAAAGVAGVSGADVDALWDWDLQAPLTTVTKAPPPSVAGA